MSEKSPEAFRTISEVADEVQVPAHVLRFWESRFVQIRPVKRAGGRRYYRPDDVELIAGIKRLLHDHGMTIRGVQKLLKDHGTAHVAALGLGQPLATGGLSPFAPPLSLPTEPRPLAKPQVAPAGSPATAPAAALAAAPVLAPAAAPHGPTAAPEPLPRPVPAEPSPPPMAPPPEVPPPEAEAPVEADHGEITPSFRLSVPEDEVAEDEVAEDPAEEVPHAARFALSGGAPLPEPILVLLHRADGQWLAARSDRLRPLVARAAALTRQLAAARS